MPRRAARSSSSISPAIPLPAADAVLCRDCLVHFSLADVWAALGNIRDSGARYLIATTFSDRTYNDDAHTGCWRTLNMEAPPFAFPRRC